MASGTAHTLLLPYLPIRLPLPACHAAASLLFYSFHRVHAVARPFMPHDQQQFVYEYLINPQLTHQWTQPIGALRPDAPHRDWAGCAIQPSIHPSSHLSSHPSLRNLKCLRVKASARTSVSATGECKTSWTHSHLESANQVDFHIRFSLNLSMSFRTLHSLYL